VDDCPTNSQLLKSVMLTTVFATTVTYPYLSFWVLSDTLTRKVLLAELGTVGMRFSSSLAVKGNVHPSKRGTGGRSSVR
jgi:DNA/RNA endonuclease YhcR with UshA esterase domain